MRTSTRSLYSNYPLYSLLYNDFSVLDPIQEIYELRTILEALRPKHKIASVFESCAGRGEQKRLYGLNFPDNSLNWKTLDLNVDPEQAIDPKDHVKADMFNYEYPESDCTLLLNNTLSVAVFHFEDGVSLFESLNSPLIISQMPPESKSSFYSPLPDQPDGYTDIEVDIPLGHPLRQQLKIGTKAATLLTSNEFYYDVVTGIITVLFKNVCAKVRGSVVKLGNYSMDWHYWSIYEVICMANLAGYKLLDTFESNNGLTNRVTGQATSIVKGSLTACKPNWLVFEKKHTKTR